jgi:hypothetical protein
MGLSYVVLLSRRQSDHMPSGDARTLGDLVTEGHERLLVACDKCGRTGNYAVAQLILKHGAGERLPDLLVALSRDCPMRKSPAGRDRCGAVYRP